MNINPLTNNWKTKGENVISAMKRLENGQLSRNCAELPNVLDNHFSSLDPNLAAEINTEVKNTFVNHITCLNIVMLVPLNFKSATSCEIDCEILLTTLRKVYRIYSCPTCMLKYASKVMSKRLYNIINTSIINGVYPCKLKHTKFIPI